MANKIHCLKAEVTVQELSYYLFFALMIVAKGIGLDSGDSTYLLLSLMALAAVIIKLFLTRHTYKEIAAMGLLCLMAFLSYRNSGRMGIMLTTLAIIGIKGIDIKKLFYIGLFLYSMSFGLTILLAGWNLIPNPLVVHEKAGLGEVIRWGMGYSTGNIFHLSYFILVIFVILCSRKPLGLRQFGVLMAGNLLVYFYSLSYTGVAVTTFYLVLTIYLENRKQFISVELVILQLFFPFILISSLLGPFLLENPLLQKLDQLLQARLSFSGYYLKNQPITLLGTRMKDIPNFWIIMDNGYVYILMTYGIVTLLIISIGYFILIGRQSGFSFTVLKMDRGIKTLPQCRELAVTLSFLLYGFMEQFISNAFMNLSLFFIGQMFYELLNLTCKRQSYWTKEIPFWTSRYQLGDHKMVKEIKISSIPIRGKKAVFFIAVGLVIGGIAWSLLAQKPDYVTVPMESLKAVNTESVYVQVEGVNGSKQELMDIMKQYQELLENDNVINQALFISGYEEKITTEEVRNMLEVSIPLAEKQKDKMEIFRIRFFELYYDLDREAYSKILSCLVETTKDMVTDFTIKTNNITKEQVGYSFGSERMEHIKDIDTYFVEKSGKIVKIEHCRTLIFWILCGGIFSYIFGNIAGLVKNFVKRRMRYES